jgi:hypothetical protein
MSSSPSSALLPPHPSSDHVEFVNLTPHAIVVYDEKKENILMTIPPSGTVARVEQVAHKMGTLGGVPTFIMLNTYLPSIVDLPEPKSNVYYIVSLFVRQRAEQEKRSDVLSPATDPEHVVRSEDGAIIGTTAFTRAFSWT